ncbi:hypothetical protein [Streptomyces yangpuensis]|uniref:hypothetical protein n=1 Tax=Streptomyces yangpuensis TaxID=1648182 RepID=UPI0037FC5439
MRASPDGTEACAPPRSASTTAPITLDEEEIGAVRPERAGPPHPLDDVLPDRPAIAVAVAAVVARYGPGAAAARLRRGRARPHHRPEPAARAADRLHLRHSSVARRIEQSTKPLGFELAHPAGLIRAGLTLTARRLLDN